MNGYRWGWIKTILLLSGSFAFAFLLGEMVHELGHFLAHRSVGTGQAGIHLDPFGGSRIYGATALPLDLMGITTAAGPFLNLAGGSLFTLLLWPRRRPELLPLILWGPVALIQEGVNLALGLLSPGCDARWIAAWGVPNWLLAALGVGCLILGTGGISRILSAGAIPGKSSFWERFLLIFFGLAFLIILRGVVSLLISPAAAGENLVPLAFAILLAAVISGLQGSRRSGSGGEESFSATWGASLLAAGLGLGLLLAQVILP